MIHFSAPRGAEILDYFGTAPTAHAAAAALAGANSMLWNILLVQVWVVQLEPPMGKTQQVADAKAK